MGRYVCKQQTNIPYCGWVEIGVRLTNENETETRDPFLVTMENPEKPIIGFNLIELMLKNSEDKEDDALLGRMLRANVSKGRESPDRPKKSNSILFYQKIPLGG